MTKISNEVAIKAQNELAHAQLADDLFDDIQIDTSDILIPKLLLMQGSSQFVADDKAKLGDFMNSVSGEKMGSINEALEIIPFYHTKCIDIVKNDGTGDLIRKDPFTPENAVLAWEGIENGEPIKRIKRLDFFCLVPKAMAKGSILPMVVSFKSTSYKTGQIILTEWLETRERNRMAKSKGDLSQVKLPFSKSFILSGAKTTNEKKQNWAIFSIQVGKDVPDETQKKCLDWLSTVKAAKNIKVDESDDRETASPEAPIEPATTGKF